MMPLKAAAGVLMSVLGSIGCAKSAESKPPDVSLLSVGATLPELSAADQHGAIHRLSEYQGRAVVVYFYPKDGTPGCTKEACAFRDIWNRFTEANVQVLGVSADSQASKAKFAADHRLPFPVLSDPDRVWIRAFGVRERLGMAARVTFLLGKDGRVAKVYPDVDPGVHARLVLEDARGI